MLLVNDKKRVGLSVLISKNNIQNEVFLPKVYLSTYNDCASSYKIISDESMINIYTGQQFFQINIDSLTYKEPLKGQYLADVLVKENNIYIASSSSSSGETSKIYQYLKSGTKVKEIEVPFRAITKIWDIDNENVLVKFYCFYPIIISYNFKSGSFFLDHINEYNGLIFTNGKLYFTGEKSGNVYLENGKLPKKISYKGSFSGISIIPKTNTTFSLNFGNDSLYITNNILSENPESNVISIQPFIQKAAIANSSNESNRRLITVDGQYQVDYTYPNNLDFFDGKNINSIKNENGENIRYNSSSHVFTFKNEYFLLNHNGLFSLKNSVAFELAKSWNENRSEFDAAFYLASIKDKFLFVLYNEQYEKEVWITDGTKNGTKLISLPHILNRNIIGLFQNKLYYLSADNLYSFDGTNEKLVGSIGNSFNFIHERSNSESIFYFFDRSNAGIKVSKLKENDKLERVFTLGVFKGIKDIGVAKLVAPNIFQIFHYGTKTAYLLQIDTKDDTYKLLKLDSTFFISNYTYTNEINQGPYFNAQQVLNNVLPNDTRDIYTNNIVKMDKNIRFKPIFQFKSKSSETISFSNLKNKSLVFVGTSRKIWQIDTTTDIATQFIYEKDNLRFQKIIDGNLYLNLCKDSQCHLYRTDGSNNNTYQLTEKPLAVQDMFVLNNELFLYASNTQVGFQIWKIKKENERKVTNSFSEKIEPASNLNFVSLVNKEENNEQITVFPNPFTAKIDVLLNESNFIGFEIFDTKGIRLFETNEDFESSIERLNTYLEQTQSSLIYLKVKTTKGVTVKKLVKQ